MTVWELQISGTPRIWEHLKSDSTLAYRFWHAGVPCRWATHKPRHWSRACRVWCRDLRSSAARLWWRSAERGREWLQHQVSGSTPPPHPPYVQQRLERRLQLYPHLSNRVVGGVDDYGLCLRVEFTGELIRVQNPVSTGVGTFSRLLKVLWGFLRSSGVTLVSTAFVKHSLSLTYAA